MGMTKDEQIVIDVLEHHAQTWDATDPQQAQSFRDAAQLLRQMAMSPPVVQMADPATVFLPEHSPAPAPLVPDPADAPPLVQGSVHTPTDPDAETPVNG